MHLEYQHLLQKCPDLVSRIEALPRRVFSGKEHPKAGAQAVFFCYAMPAPPPPALQSYGDEPPAWTEEAGETRWYLFDVGFSEITDDPTRIVQVIRSTPETPRKHDLQERMLSDIRVKIEKHIKNTYFVAGSSADRREG